MHGALGPANPQPDLARWAAIRDPETRLQAALEELYAYYGHTEAMLTNVLRDESTMPTVARMLAFYRDYLGRARDTLLAGRPERGHARRRACRDRARARLLDVALTHSRRGPRRRRGGRPGLRARTRPHPLIESGGSRNRIRPPMQQNQLYISPGPHPRLSWSVM